MFSHKTVKVALSRNTGFPFILEMQAKMQTIRFLFLFSDAIQDPVNPHLFVANLRGKESIKCELFFAPTQVSTDYQQHHIHTVC